MDQSDGWAESWSIHSHQHDLEDNSRGCGVMFWASIVCNKITGLFKVYDGIKINSK